MGDAAMWDLEIQGKTAMLVAVDGAIRGLLGVADTPKPEAFSTVRALVAMGMDVWMVRKCPTKHKNLCIDQSSEFCIFYFHL